MKNRVGSTCATVILIALVTFLAVDVGFSLYNPNRLAAALSVCTLNIISGDIRVQTKDTLTWEKAEDGMVLETGSRVRTDPGSHASLTFSQGTTTKLEPGTDLILARLEGNEATRPDTIVLQQRAGKTWNQVAARSDDEYYFKIQTSSADVRVYGTLFSTEVDKAGKTLVQTAEGQVNVSSQGQEVQVPAGQQTQVEPGTAPSAPVPVPPARNEMVFTIGKPAVGMVVDPSGSRTGYLPDGSILNQISGSRLSPSGGSFQTIRIREPATGEYSVILHGVGDGGGSFSVEGFTEGSSTFLHTGSSNVTSANDLILRLHMNVLDGLLQGATLLSLESSEGQPVVIKTTLKAAPRETASAALPPKSAGSGTGISVTSIKEDKSGRESAWWRQEDYNQYDQRLVITGAVILLVVIFAVVWRKH